MRIRLALLTVSLALNAAFLCLTLAARNEKNSSRSAAASPPGLGAAGKSTKPLASKTWADLPGNNLSSLRAALLAEGFPPAMVRAIINMRLREPYNQRRKALEADIVETPFWKVARPDPKLQAQLRALNKEELKVVKDFLGPDPDSPANVRLRQALPNLASDKLDRVSEILDKYTGLRQDTNVAARGASIADHNQQLAALNQQLQSELGTVLTPAELEDYNLRESDTSNSLRMRLSAFDASEAEFRSLYQLQSRFDEQNLANAGLNSPAQMQAQAAAWKDLNAQIATALGPDRYAEYQRDTDYSYMQTANLVARLQAPPETANTLYAMQKEMQQRSIDIFKAQGTPNSPGSIYDQLAALQQEATTRVTTLLGTPDAVAAYKQYGGSWLNNLLQRAPPVKK